MGIKLELEKIQPKFLSEVEIIYLLQYNFWSLDPPELWDGAFFLYSRVQLRIYIVLVMRSGSGLVTF